MVMMRRKILYFSQTLSLNPRNVNQLSRLMGYCDSNKIPVTPRGAGTGLSGASLPINKGVLVSMEHFDTKSPSDIRHESNTAPQIFSPLKRRYQSQFKGSS